MGSARLTRRQTLSLGAAWLVASRAARAQDAVVTVSIEQQRFEPASLSIQAGTTVRWVNNEKRTSHSILFKGEGGLESERLLPGDSWQRRFEHPGRYPYTCGPHPEMNGVVEVRP